MADHAILSPSSASRWLACPPSARLESRFPDTSGTAVKEGTLAHSLGELLIRYKSGEIKKAQYTKALAEIETDPLYEDVMFEHCDNYATYVIEQFNAAQVHTKDALLFIEQKLDLTKYIPEGFGTGDAGIIADTTLTCVDLKYGKGVAVSAVGNKQMKLYALGWLNKFESVYDITAVKMVIYQPRLDTVSEFEISVVELKQWAANELIPLAALAFEGKGDFAPGDHCRFCKARATCRANAEYNLEIAKYDFKEGNLLTDEEIADILNRADRFKKWVNGMEEYALTEAVNNGKVFPGFKLVEGRSNRAYGDESAVATKLLTDVKLTEEEIYTKKIIGITALEKLLGKKAFEEYISPLVVKPAGKPTLVPESDKRPAINTLEAAKVDFATEVDE